MNTRTGSITRNLNPMNSILYYCHTGILFLYNTIIFPKSAGEDSRRREFILNIILSASSLLLLVLNLLVVYNSVRLGDRYEGVPLGVFLPFLLFFIGLLILSRVGKYKISSYILIAAYFIAITYAAYQWGPDLPSALLGYALLITISSILINTRFGLLLTLTVSALIIILTYLQGSLVIIPRWEWKKEILGIHDG